MINNDNNDNNYNNHDNDDHSKGFLLHEQDDIFFNYNNSSLNKKNDNNYNDTNDNLSLGSVLHERDDSGGILPSVFLSSTTAREHSSNIYN